ncbi:hypothetical protein NOLU111490_16945 [Novosphingobium lubricantis]
MVSFGDAALEDGAAAAQALRLLVVFHDVGDEGEAGAAFGILLHLHHAGGGRDVGAGGAEDVRLP